VGAQEIAGRETAEKRKGEPRYPAVRSN